MDDWEAEDFQPLPAKVFGLKKSVDMLIPKSESDFLDYAELISQRLVPFEKSFHYIGLLKAVMRLSLANMKAADVKDVASSITAIANEKLKAEKEAAAGKKKSDVMERGSENNNHNTKPSPTPRLRYREISTGENSGDIDIPTDLVFTKPICEKRTGTIGGLGVWKLNTKVEESYEARKKFSNAKSISSSQFFGDQNKASDLELEFTLEKLSNDFSSLVGKTKERLGTLGSVITGLKKGIFPRKPGNPDDIKALRRDVTDLMQKLRSEDAHAIPWDIRMKWVEKVCAQLVEVTLGVDLAGGLGPTVYNLREDAWNLSEQLIIERDRERASREREFKLV